MTYKLYDLRGQGSKTDFVVRCCDILEPCVEGDRPVRENFRLPVGIKGDLGDEIPWAAVSRENGKNELLCERLSIGGGSCQRLTRSWIFLRIRNRKTCAQTK
jgi:hypothetical protein